MVDPDAANSSEFQARGRVRRGLRRVLLVGLVAYVTVMVIAMLLENSLIYFPIRYPQGQWEPTGLQYEDVWFESADGTRLHGWYLPGKNPRLHLLFSHGNAGNITHRLPLLYDFQDQPEVSVFIYDYRGFGKSEGRPNEAGVLADAQAARRWLAEREGVAKEDVVVMGRSLGAAVSVHLAADGGARGLIVESGFTSMPDVAAYHYGWLPVRWLMRTRLDAESKIKQYDGPLLQCHSEHDEIIPLELGQRLFEAAPGPKRFVLFRDSLHNDPHPPEYYEALRDFLDSL